MRKYLLCFAALLVSLHVSAAPLSKEETLRLYRELYLASAIDTIVWNGSVQECRPGTLQAAIYTKATDRINFFRLMNGLPKIRISAGNNKYPQAAALMMRANDQLNHNPPKTWKCYSAEGYKGASRSCLSTTNFHYFRATAFITSFIEDNGDENYFCGHRRWLLYSRAATMGYGATGATEAVYVDQQYLPPLDTAKAPAFIAYPWKGYVPYKLVFDKWSFALPEGHKVDFSNVQVTVTDETGAVLPLKLYPEKKHLDPAITWKMLSLFTEQEERYGVNRLKEKGFVGKRLTVMIKGVVVDGRQQDYAYEFQLVDES
jgi:uncharacterized protein YkwD